MGARPYNPTLGRFLEVDPIDGGSCNDYDYTCADPVNQFDLSGLWCVFGKNKNGSCRGSGVVRTGVRKTYQAGRFVANSPKSAFGWVATKATTSGSDCGINWQEIMILCTGASRGLANQRDGTAYGSLYVTSKDAVSPDRMAHEGKHADQSLLPGFWFMYGAAEVASGGGSCNPFERAAGLSDGGYTPRSCWYGL